MRFPYQVPCPVCGVGGGWPCIDPTGAIIIGFHDARTDYAQR